ncbi:MAG: hypothetical protein K9K38_00420 [Rhodoferax sp.]|nr:hypothetical protein [Rhodoferax sp.]MCF8207865.1 hypothetical protein [Rhodoferax sp.]
MSRTSPQDDHPLGLTVYTLQQPDAVAVDAQARTRLGRWKMLAVLLVCAAPVIASYFTYYVVRPDGRRNFGELIDPQRPLPDALGYGLDAKPVKLRELKGQWLLISVASGACDTACAERLYLQRQLREGLGKEKDRLDWVWLVSDEAPVAEALQPALKGATVLRLGSATLSQWLQASPGQDLSAHLYVVDPLGNWMMRFPPGLNTVGALKARRDLERLMRASTFWDHAGR